MQVINLMVITGILMLFDGGLSSLAAVAPGEHLTKHDLKGYVYILQVSVPSEGPNGIYSVRFFGAGVEQSLLLIVSDELKVEEGDTRVNEWLVRRVINEEILYLANKNSETLFARRLLMKYYLREFAQHESDGHEAQSLDYFVGTLGLELVSVCSGINDLSGEPVRSYYFRSR